MKIIQSVPVLAGGVAGVATFDDISIAVQDWTEETTIETGVLFFYSANRRGSDNHVCNLPETDNSLNRPKSQWSSPTAWGLWETGVSWIKVQRCRVN
jgi:hypothetical protein